MDSQEIHTTIINAWHETSIKQSACWKWSIYFGW